LHSLETKVHTLVTELRKTKMENLGLKTKVRLKSRAQSEPIISKPDNKPEDSEAPSTVSTAFSVAVPVAIPADLDPKETATTVTTTTESESIPVAMNPEQVARVRSDIRDSTSVVCDLTADTEESSTVTHLVEEDATSELTKTASSPRFVRKDPAPGWEGFDDAGGSSSRHRRTKRTSTTTSVSSVSSVSPPHMRSFTTATPTTAASSSSVTVAYDLPASPFPSHDHSTLCPHPRDASKLVHKNKIFVGGLASLVSGDELKKYFSKYGEVADCVVMKDRVTGASRGFGFVTFADDDGERIILDILNNQHVILGKRAQAKLAEATDADYSRSGHTIPLGSDDFNYDRASTSRPGLVFFSLFLSLFSRR
jgi:RNA-binding protein Musashi